MSSGQRRHEDGIAERVSKEADRCIDLVQVYLRQCLMHELYIMPVCPLWGGNILSKRNVHMFYLALLHLVRHAYSFHSSRRKPCFFLFKNKKTSVISKISTGEYMAIGNRAKSWRR